MNFARKFAIATALVACSVSTVSTVSAQNSRFGLFANAFLDSTRSPSTRVTVEIPFRNLIFFKKEGIYDARYDVYLSIYHADGEELMGTFVLHGYATVKTYEETKKRDLRSRTSREFAFGPGEYIVDATLRVKQTRIVMERSVTVSVPDFLASGIGFGTPRVIMVPSDRHQAFARWSEFDAGTKSIPAETELADMSLSVFDRHPAVRFELFMDRDTPEPVPCELFYEVVDGSNRQVLYGRKTIELTGADDVFVVGFQVDDWEVGVYKVNFRATTTEPERDATASVDLRIDMTRAMLGVNFDETLDMLSLIAAKEDLKALKEADESRRPQEWSKFWAARDPDPTTPVNEELQEFFARILYVNQHFSQLGPGWRTDRGMVYVKHGKPDQIDRSSDRRNQGEYEIWRYASRGFTFVFYDRFGVGDFQLVQGDLF